MWPINQLSQVHARSVIVGQGGEICVFGLSGHKLRPRIVQEDVMHQDGPPRNRAVRAPETLIAD